MFIVIILFYGIIGLLDMTPLIKNRQFKELIVYIPIFCAAFALMLLISFEVEFPNPADRIGEFISNLTGVE